MIHPASMTEDQRNEYRDSFAGMHSFAVQRHAVPGGVYYTSERAGYFCAIGFAGKALKPSFTFRFSTEERRQQYIDEWTSKLARIEQERNRRRDERKNDTHNLVKGSILSSTWGYEQTNVNWYEVTAVISSKTVEIRQIAAELVDDGMMAMSGTAKPKPGHYTSEPMRKRATAHGIVITSYSTATPWDGRPRYVSWYA